MNSLERPANPNSNYINYFATLCAVLAYLYCRHHRIGGADAGMFIIAVYAFFVLGLEVVFLRTYRRDSVGLDFSRRDTAPSRIGIKLVGVYCSFLFVAFLYWLFPEYHGSYYDFYWQALRKVGPWVLLAVPFYVIFMDERLREPYDGYYHFGRTLLFGPEGAKGHGRVLVQHLLGWVVKGYFLPLMFVSICGNFNHLSSLDFTDYFSGFSRFFGVATDILFTVDLLAAVAGYVFAIRLFDTHFRSAEPTLFGWLICLICYEPFLSVVMRFYMSYPNNDWQAWMMDYPVLESVWGVSALFFLIVYTLASLNFGCRFSNLTHRGVLTKGMYRFSKHPAYVSKNIFWWMTYVPFLSHDGWSEAIRYSLLVGAVSCVYYLRARTEEAHLSRDPAYVEYALYMNDHSIFRGLARYLPFLKYKAPKGWEKLERPYEGIK